jgi:hypothetical protein
MERIATPPPPNDDDKEEEDGNNRVIMVEKNAQEVDDGKRLVGFQSLTDPDSPMVQREDGQIVLGRKRSCRPGMWDFLGFVGGVLATEVLQY